MTPMGDYFWTEMALRKARLIPTEDVVIIQDKRGVVISVESRKEIFKKIENENN